MILSSGYYESEIEHRFAGKGLAGFVQKPYQLATLRVLVEKVFGADAAEDSEPSPTPD